MSEPVVVERALLTSSEILGRAGEAVEQRKALRLLADVQAGETIEDTGRHSGIMVFFPVGRER